MVRKSHSPQYVLHPLVGQWTIILAIGLTHIQCTWTPEIETVLHQDQNGSIALQTTKSFKISPNHPISLSDSLIQKILVGITKQQEDGMLQHLLSGPSPKLPAFSSSQTQFLAPQLALALSKATSEEIISFTCAANDEKSSVVIGTVAVFHPTTFAITLKYSPEASLGHKKGKNSLGNLHRNITIQFSQESALVKPEETPTLMDIPKGSHGILVNYELLKISPRKDQVHPSSKPGTHLKSQETGQDPSEIDALNEQLQDLQRKVDEQSKEIRRLQQTSP